MRWIAELYKATVRIPVNSKAEMESGRTWQGTSGNALNAVNAVNV